jgi:hypothetical protein
MLIHVFQHICNRNPTTLYSNEHKLLVKQNKKKNRTDEFLIFPLMSIYISDVDGHHPNLAIGIAIKVLKL